MSCPFCQPSNPILIENEFCLAIRDGFPISPGHTLIIPKRHVASFFELDRDERDAMMDLLTSAKSHLESEFSPDGFNIGINDGHAGGQTIMHLHLHLIPRYIGDMPDPRGGIRLIFPEKADYWSDRS
jgi:diadenosine tetraphosphate (Ap4A) HIT family hydrolase